MAAIQPKAGDDYVWHSLKTRNIYSSKNYVRGYERLKYVVTNH